MDFQFLWCAGQGFLCFFEAIHVRVHGSDPGGRSQALHIVSLNTFEVTLAVSF